ncbi:MAG: PQQ-binding-like beta-propeller repeat protein [Caldisericia bacterium]|nr:PQQ-binding-like beta-propeller repeat protein [Caldisericia bacterium]
MSDDLIESTPGMKTKVAIIVLLFLMLQLFADVMAGGCDWVMHRGNAGRSGAIPAGCELDLNRFSKYWDYDTGSAIISSPVIYNDKIVYISNNRLYCVSDSGKKKWSKSLSRMIEPDTIPVIWENYIYIPDWRSIDVFSLLNGRESSPIVTNSKVVALLIVQDRGLFYTSTSNNKSYITYQKSPHSPKKERTLQLAGADVGIPAYSSGRVYVASGEYVYAINYRTLNIIWKKRFSGGITGNNIAISGGYCLFATGAGDIVCLNSVSGEEKWTYKIGLPVSTCPAVYGSTVLIGATPKIGNNTPCKLIAVNLSSGKLKWTFNGGAGESILSSPLGSDRVYFATNIVGNTETKGNIYCLDIKNGSTLWKIKNTSGFSASPAISDGLIFFGDLDGRMTCFGEGVTILGFQLGQTTVSIDSKNISIDVEPVVQHNRTLIPARYVIEPLGGWVRWDEKERKVTSYFDGKIVEFWIGKNEARVAGKMEKIDKKNPGVVPTIIDGRTMVPFRFLGESVGCDVKWLPETKEIRLTYRD